MAQVEDTDALRARSAENDVIHLVVDRWQLALDAVQGGSNPASFTGSPAVVFASFDFEQARTEWFRLKGPNLNRNRERNRYTLIEVATDDNAAQ